jgi:hypothetical protein
MPVAGPESRLLLIFFMNSYIMVYILEIQLCKYFSPKEPVKGLINKRKRMPILDYNLIKAAIINIKVQPSVLLRDEKDRCPYGAFIRPYLTLIKCVL